MGNIISNMGLYDLFARGVTGVVVLCTAELFGIANILESGIPAWAIILCGYFLGLVLEELSLIRKKGFYRKDGKERIGSRKRIEVHVCAEYPEYDFENCKRALIANDKEVILDEPLSHIVMSASFKIAFILLAVVKLIQVICCRVPALNIFGMPVDENICVAIFSVCALIALSLIFSQRERHYCERRTKNIFDYCIAKDYPNTKKTPNKDKKEFQNSWRVPHPKAVRHRLCTEYPLCKVQANSESSDSIIQYSLRGGVVFYDALLLFQPYSRRHTHDYKIPYL